MTNDELLKNLLRGAERQSNGLTESIDELTDLIGKIYKSFMKRGFSEEQSIFLAMKVFEITLGSMIGKAAES